MTSEIEKQFFKTFGIKSKTYVLCTCSWDCIDAQPCEKCYYGKLIEDEYPEITDSRLVKLICIIGSIYICIQNRETLKEHILVQCINAQTNGRNIKRQVKALFKGE